MSSPKFKPTWKTLILPIIGVVAFIVYIYLFNVDIPTIVGIMRQTDLYFYSWAIIFLFLQTFFFALSWRFLVNFLSVKLSIVRAFLYVWYGIFIDIIIPAESLSGELSKVYLIAREQNGTSGKVVASLAIQRFIGMAVNVITLLVGVSLLIAKGQFGGIILNLAVFLTVMITAFLAMLLLLCVKEEWTRKIIDSIFRFAEWIGRGRLKLTKFKEEAAQALRIFHESIKSFGRAYKALFASSVFFVIAWILSLTVDFLIFKCVGYFVPWEVIMVSASIFVAVKSIPIGVPFEIGLPEITMTTLYIAFGVDPKISATVTILNRILTLWLRFFVGFAIQEWIEIKAIRMFNHNASEVADKT
ncbi:MAG: lysylphosphatidylglycerol synthase transmembrane domain-containing protein [Candidatus Bathyarchaeales archaeon]